MTPRTLYYGDCLEWMQQWQRELVDLIYLDPPFNSKTAYNTLLGKGSGVPAQVRAFDDTWRWDQAAATRVEAIERAVAHPAHLSISWLRNSLRESGMLAYLSYMAQRLAEMHRILKPTGSIYVHCDPTASHYLKIIMDEVFGGRNFLNEIVWRRTSAHSDAKRCGAITDRLLLYSKSEKWTWNQQFMPYDDGYKGRFRYTDPDGRAWMDDNLTAKGLSGGGYEYEYKGTKSLWRVPRVTMDRLDSEGRLHFTSRGGIRQKRYLDELEGRPIQDLWDDISPINSQSKERLGYPTQKPLKLLERVIGLSPSLSDPPRK